MKCRMVVSGLLCLWAVSQITMPPSAEAGRWFFGRYYAKGGYVGGGWYIPLFPPGDSDSNIAGDSNPGPGTSVTEHTAPNPAVCKGGYRWGRVTPDDFITKIYC